MCPAASPARRARPRRRHGRRGPRRARRRRRRASSKSTSRSGCSPSDARRGRPPSSATFVRLPLRDECVDAVVAAFSLNHLADPERRRGRSGRACCDRVAAWSCRPTPPTTRTRSSRSSSTPCAARAGVAPDWYRGLQQDADAPARHARARARRRWPPFCPGRGPRLVRVPFPELDRRALVEWRLGMAQFAPFVASLDAHAPAGARRGCGRPLVDDTPLVRSIVVVTLAEARVTVRRRASVAIREMQ